MKKISWWYLASLLFVSLTFTACSKDEEPEVPVVEEPEEIEFSEVSDFVWRGLNHWYFWQNSLPALADSKLNDLDAYHTYLNSYSTPEQLFNALVNRSVDDFSWYIPDVAEQLKQFAG
ncbi:MAG: peptidase S41, partial [Flavobacteriaceae bacterium]|nr:peptidase S41 [Flavobacteriaceae bacterium]MDP4795110.1 peptidase S41 [Flavobacteriaceae bacterium]MDP4885011.1 peptidase S41 [Flavobacteriaceae bacterium]MDP4971513.1 peptidase S41 [Flavobacteriaceae bacterium]